MPEFDKLDFEVIDDWTDNGGVAEDTKKKTGYTAAHLNKFLVQFYAGRNLQMICKEESGQKLIDTLNDCLRGYFQAMKITGRDGEKMSPKRNTADCARSHLKKIIKAECGLDIGSDEFSRFNVSILNLENFFKVKIF